MATKYGQGYMLSAETHGSKTLLLIKNKKFMPSTLSTAVTKASLMQVLLELPQSDTADA
jgi:hypothetical protein